MWHSHLPHRINNKTHNQPHSHTTCHTSLSLYTFSLSLSLHFFSFSLSLSNTTFSFSIFFPFETKTKVERFIFFGSFFIGEKRKKNKRKIAEMSEVKDPAIKLFGKTIPVPEIPRGSAGAPASSSGDVVDDSVDASSTNSSRESHTKRDALGKDVDKVLGGDFRVWKILILSVTLYLKCEKN